MTDSDNDDTTIKNLCDEIMRLRRLIFEYCDAVTSRDSDYWDANRVATRDALWDEYMRLNGGQP